MIVWNYWGRDNRRVLPSRMLAIDRPTPLSAIERSRWTAKRKYRLHVLPNGDELVVPDELQWRYKSLLVEIDAVGDTWVDESAQVPTFEDANARATRFITIEPRGRDWVRDAPADADADKWTMWRRRREIAR